MITIPASAISLFFILATFNLSAFFMIIGVFCMMREKTSDVMAGVSALMVGLNIGLLFVVLIS